MAYDNRQMIGYQLLDTTPQRGTGHFGAVDLVASGCGRSAMPGGHSSTHPPLRQAFPPKGGHPTAEGGAHAHRSDFRQGAYAPAGAAVLGSCAPDLLHPPGVGVRVKGSPATLPAKPGSGADAALPWFVFRWNRHGRKGQRCQVLARGAMNSRLLRFEDGYTMISSGNALAKEKRTPSALRAPGDISGAGAPALVRAPALPRGKRAAR